MTRPLHIWEARPQDYRLIWEHLTRQAGLDQREFVRLDDGRVVRVGWDAHGEGTR